MGIGASHPFESPWAGEKGRETWSSSLCSNHPPGNLMRPGQPRVPSLGKPHVPPFQKNSKACGEKESKGETQSCRVVAVGKATGGGF